MLGNSWELFCSLIIKFCPWSFCHSPRQNTSLECCLCLLGITQTCCWPLPTGFFSGCSLCLILRQLHLFEQCPHVVQTGTADLAYSTLGSIQTLLSQLSFALRKGKCAQVKKNSTQHLHKMLVGSVKYQWNTSIVP